MKEKKLLSAKEIEAQTALELPDRQLMNTEVNVSVAIALTFIFMFITG
jgi:hypothetical protein